MNNSKLTQWALVQSIAVFIYSSLVVLLMMNGEKIFGKADNFGSGIAILMLFVLSAAIVGSLILAKPLMLYLDGLKKEAVKLLVYTIIILFIITAIAMLVVVLL